jgi:hypothetical protein
VACVSVARGMYLPNRCIETAIVFLRRIVRFIFVMETQYVYYAVGTEYLNIIQIVFMLQVGQYVIDN